MYKSSKIRFLSLFLCLAVVFSSLPFTAMTASAEVEPSKPTAGDGTASNPYQITNETELLWFAEGVNNGTTGICAELTANITLTGTESNWTPIGSDSKKYTGTFDGKGHEVQNIQFNDSAKEYVGLFGYVGSGGKVQNVGVTGGSITGRQNVGGVCGYNSGMISNCYNSGSIIGEASYVGGVCGYNNKETISNCYNSGSVSGGASVGGVCGGNNKGVFINCYNSGSVRANEAYAGGVCGENSKGTYTNCYWENSTGKGGKGIGNNTTAITTPFTKEANAEPTVESGKKLVDLLNANRTDAGKTAEWSQWYTDKNADKYPTFNPPEITTYSDLKAFLEDTGDFAGITSAKLTQTVTATDGDVTQPGSYKASAHVTTATNKTLDTNGCDIDFNNKNSIYVAKNATLTVTNSNYPTTRSNIKNGIGVGDSVSTSGGAFFNAGTLNIYDINITNCTATSMGGGIYNNNEATVTLTNVDIADCKTDSNGGGGIYSQYGTLTMTGGSITNCTAKTCGGGIHNYKATATLTDVDIADCKAGYNSGGGIYNEGDEGDTLTIAGGSIKNCTAGSDGGGIENLGTLTMTKASITNCTAKNSYGGGGGIDNYGTATLTDVMVTKCTATNFAGVLNAGYMTLAGNTKITGNKDDNATNSNLCVYDTQVTLAPSFNGNAGVTVLNDDYEPSPSAGTFATGTDIATLTSLFTPDNPTKYEVYAPDDNHLALSPKIVTYGDLKAFLEDTGDFKGMTSAKLTKTVTATDGNVTEKGVVPKYTASAHVTASTPKTIDLNGYDIDFNKKNSIYIPSGATLTVTNSSLTTQSNIRNGSGVKAMRTLLSTSIRGGAFFNCGTLSISNVKITDCTAKYGGGICNGDDTANDIIVMLNTVAVTNCTATDCGSGIYNIGTATLTDVTVTECTATNYAGVHNEYGNMTLAGNTQIAGNKDGNATPSNLVVLNTSYKTTPVTLAQNFNGTVGVTALDGSKKPTSGIFATGTNISGLMSNFTSDIDKYDVVAKGNNNLALAPKIVTYSDLKAFLEDTGDFKGMTSAKLTKTVTATDTDVTEYDKMTASAHVTATDITKTIDLNGFDIDFNNNNSIYVKSGANLTVTNTNTATQSNIKNGIGVSKEVASSPEPCYYGGAFYNNGTLSVYDVNIKDCSANYGGGGGIYNYRMYPGTTKLTLDRVCISGCRSNDSIGGGGIYNNCAGNSEAIMELKCVTITDCNTDNYGGGIYNAYSATLTDVTITKCTATNYAGVYNVSGNMTLAGNTQITDNKDGNATNSNLVVFNASYSYSPVTLAPGFTGNAGVTVLNNDGNPSAGKFATGEGISGLAGKFTSDIDGYYVYAPGNNSLALAEPTQITSYSDLKAFLEDTGDFKGMTSAKLTKTVKATDTDVTTNSDFIASAHVTATDITKTIDLNGYDIDFNNKNSIYVYTGANLTVTNTNTATTSNIKNGAGVESRKYSPVNINGGAFWNQGTLNIYGVNITDCTATDMGGGVYNAFTVELTDVSITRCTANQGGGIDSGEAFATLTNVTVKECTATKFAGVLNAGYMTLAGNTQIISNKTDNGTDSNLNVYYTPVTLAPSFNGNADVTVLNENQEPSVGTFATGTDISKFADNFTSDIDKYEVYAPDKNHLALRCAHINWNYTTTKTNVDGDTIYATCTNCSTATSLTVTSTDVEYDGEAHGATFTDTTGWTGAGLELPEINYTGIEGTTYEKTTATPTNAGTYQASITVDTATAKTQYTIAKATATATTLPTTITNLVYDGSEKALITTGSGVTGGLFYYKLRENGEWRTSVPTATNAGSYDVYYKVSATDVNYKDSEPTKLTANIAGKQLTGTVTINGTPEIGQTLTANYSGSETVSYQWYRGDNEAITSATDIAYTPTTVDIGNIIKVIVTGTGNYAGSADASTADKVLGIPELTDTPKAVKPVIQAETTDDLITAGSATNGTIEYKLDNEGSWGTTVPKAISSWKSGETHTVWYKVTGSTNYKNLDPCSIKIEVYTGTVVVSDTTIITHTPGTTEVEAQGAKCENLEVIAPKEKVENSDVKIELVVTATTLTNIPGKEQIAFGSAIENVFTGVTRTSLHEEYLDVKINKTITKGDTTTSTYINETDNVLEIAVSYTNLLDGKTPVIIRYHDNKAVAFNKLQTRPTSDFKDGTFYVKDNKIYLYSKYYSDYAMVYANEVCPTVSFDVKGGTEVSPRVVTSGTTITLPTSTKSGYTLSGWSDGATIYNAGSSYKVGNEDVNFTAVWKQNGGGEDTPTQYTITATATDGGTIDPSGTVKVTEGKNQSFTATANDGYTLEKFVVDGRDEYINGNTYTFEKVAKNHTIQAVFAKKEEPVPPTPTPTPTDTGWKKTDDGKWQYLDENGKAVTGWQNSIKGWEGQWFYFDNSGIMQTGWYNNIPGWGDKWFYFDRTTGVMQRGWAFVDDGHGDFTNKLWYYLDPTTGAMHTDWQKIDGKWYYLDYNRNHWGGAMVTGWQWIPYSAGEAWFCFANNGAMYENCITPDGYTVDASGVWKQ